MEDVPFVDAHAHFWDLAQLAYPWLTPPFADDGPNGSVAAIARTYLPDAYRADLAPLVPRGVVHVDAGADPRHALDETRWLEALGRATELPTAIVAYAALEDPAAAALLAAQAAHPRVRGIRQIVNWHPDPWRSYTPCDLTRDAQWQAGYALLARYALSFDLQCYPGQLPALAAVLAREPHTPVIVNHLGMPVLSDPDGIADWRRGLRALAALPHVAIKISGFGFIDRNWTLATIRPFVAEAIDLFGPRRCLFASDMPTDALFAPPHRCIAALCALAAEYSEDERRDMMGRNANRIYRLGLDL